MKGNADQAKIGAAMTKGEAPFDLAKVKKIFATFEDTAAKAPALFPEHSIDQPTADDPYTASPKIWDGSVTNLESFKKALGNIGKNDCGSCHEKYRLKQS